MQLEPINFSLKDSRRSRPCWHVPSKTQWTDSTTPQQKSDQPDSVDSSTTPWSPFPFSPASPSSSSPCGKVCGDRQDDDSAANRNHARASKRETEKSSNLNNTVKRKDSELVKKENTVKLSCRCVKSKPDFRAKSRGGNSKADTISSGQSFKGCHRSARKMSSTSQLNKSKAIKTPSSHFVSSTSAKIASEFRFLDVPTEEYDQIESCVTRGLKLTFRRRSTEKSQTQQTNVKSAIVRTDIPKLIVQKCKCSHGYSLQNSKREAKCTCLAGAAAKIERNELPVGPGAKDRKREGGREKRHDDFGRPILKRAPKLEKRSVSETMATKVCKVDFTASYHPVLVTPTSLNGENIPGPGTSCDQKLSDRANLESNSHCAGNALGERQSEQTASLTFEKDPQRRLAMNARGLGDESSSDAAICPKNSGASEIADVQLNTRDVACAHDSNRSPEPLSEAPQGEDLNAGKQNRPVKSGRETDVACDKRQFSDYLDISSGNAGTRGESESSQRVSASVASTATSKPEKSCTETSVEGYIPVELSSSSCSATFPSDAKSSACYQMVEKKKSEVSQPSANYFRRNVNSSGQQLSADARNEHQPHVPKLKRSDSAPPRDKTSTSLLSEQNLTFSIQTPDSSSLGQNHILALNQVGANESVSEPERPKSSPPICYADNDTSETSTMKSPVVILDRLPSPVIELYSLRSFSGIDSNSFSSFDIYSDSSSSEPKDFGIDDQISEYGDSSEGSTLSDFEARSKTSGKLKFTFRKVAQKKKYRIKSRMKPSYNKKKQADKGYLDNEALDMTKGGETVPQKGRKRYSRASKRAIRYVDDDDEYEDEINAKANAKLMTSSLSPVARSALVNVAKNKESTKRADSLSGERKVKTKAKRIIKKVSLETVSGGPRDGLVDPRIRAMSSVLLSAYHTNTDAENIAFRKKNSISGFRKLMSRKNSSRQRCQAVAKIRRKFSRNQFGVCKKTGLSAGDEAASGSSEFLDDSTDVKFSSEKRTNSERASHSSKLSTVADCKPHKRETDSAVRMTPGLVSDTQRLHPKYRNLFESDVFSCSFTPEFTQPNAGPVDAGTGRGNKERPRPQQRKRSGQPCRNVVRRRERVEVSGKGAVEDNSGRSQTSSRCNKCLCMRFVNDKGGHALSTAEEKKSALQYEMNSFHPADDMESDFKSTEDTLKLNDESMPPLSYVIKTSKSSKEAAAVVESALDLSGKTPPRASSAPNVQIKTENTLDAETYPVFMSPDDDAQSLHRALIKLERSMGSTGDCSETRGELRGLECPEEKVDVTKDTDLMGLDYHASEEGRRQSAVNVRRVDGTIGETPGSSRPKVNQGQVGHIVWNLQASGMKHVTSLYSEGSNIELIHHKARTGLSSAQADHMGDSKNDPSVSCRGKTDVFIQNREAMPNLTINSVIKYSSSSGLAAPSFMRSSHPSSAEQTNPLGNYPSSTCPPSNIPPLTLNKPLSIQICQSPENSDYGSPPSLTEYSASTWLHPQNIGHRNPQIRDTSLNTGDSTHQTEAVKADDSQLTTQVLSRIKGQTLREPLRISTSESNLPNKPVLPIPRMIVTSPSAPNVLANTPPPSAPSSSSSFISTYPSLVQLPKSTSRSSSPFRLPSNPISPYKSPSRHNNDAEHKSLVENPSTRGSEVDNDKSPHNWVSPNCLRHMHKTHLRRAKPPLYAVQNGFDDGDSGDSDSTLLYPTADKRGYCCKSTIHSRRSSLGVSSTGISEASSNSALNSPSLKQEDRLHAMMSPACRSLEKRQSDLSTIVSDLRATISKSKAMKRNRRTNSFSGDHKSQLSERDVGLKAISSRPNFERFMSVEPMLDSDTPYATVTKGMDGEDDARSEDFEMMRFVSGLHLQPKPCAQTGSVSSVSVAETQVYGLDCSQRPALSVLCQDNKDDVARGKIKIEEVNIGDTKLQISDISSDVTNVEAGFPRRKSRSSPTEARANDSGSDDRRLVVIENAESDVVIDGHEAYEKVVSGNYRLPTGSAVKPRRRGAKRRPRKDMGLRISVRSLLSRKPPGKGGHCFCPSQTSRDRFHARKRQSTTKTGGKCACGHSTVKSKRATKKYGRKRKCQVGGDNRCLCGGVEGTSLQPDRFFPLHPTLHPTLYPKTVSNTASNTVSKTVSNIASNTASNTVSKTVSNTASNTAPNTLSITVSNTASNSAAITVSNTASNSASITVSNTASNSASITVSNNTSNAAYSSTFRKPHFCGISS